MKPELRSEDDARKAVQAWRGKPAHINPAPGQEALTASDDVEAPEHNEPSPRKVTNPKPEEDW